MKKTIRRCLTLLFLLLIPCILTSCTGPVTEKPVIIEKPPISDTLVTCAPMPAHPCPDHPSPPDPQPEPETRTADVSHETIWQKVYNRFNPITPETLAEIKGGAKTDPPAAAHETRICTEKQRLRWEAMMMHWGRDCESKLKAVRGLINKTPQ